MCESSQVVSGCVHTLSKPSFSSSGGNLEADHSYVICISLNADTRKYISVISNRPKLMTIFHL